MGKYRNDNQGHYFFSRLEKHCIYQPFLWKKMDGRVGWRVGSALVAFSSSFLEYLVKFQTHQRHRLFVWHDVTVDFFFFTPNFQQPLKPSVLDLVPHNGRKWFFMFFPFLYAILFGLRSFLNQLWCQLTHLQWWPVQVYVLGNCRYLVAQNGLHLTNQHDLYFKSKRPHTHSRMAEQSCQWITDIVPQWVFDSVSF